VTPADLDLARRAVACAGWRWVPGMRSTCGRIVYAAGHVFAVGVYVGDQRVRPSCSALAHDALPDFNDDATRGCLLGLVREARHAPLGHTVHVSGEHLWAWRDSSEHFTDVYGKTEAAALVAALEAACQ
jgi:hypothetical protein